MPTAVFFAPWRFEVALCTGLGVAALLYARGWWILQRRDPERFPSWRLLCFQAGLAAVLYATASPLDALADFSLRAHMFQHVLLTFVAPPLVWLGEPLVPLLRGLPRRFRKEGLGPFLAWPALRRALRAITHPAFAWGAFVGTMWIWHVPALYELALREPGWHELEHGLFFASALLFWFPIVQPRPSRPRWPRAAMLVYLGLAAVQNTVFSAVFAFSNRVLYPSYADAGPLLRIDPLADQAAAGALLWVLGMLAMAPALAGSTLAALEKRGVQPARGAAPRRAPRAWSPAPFDLLRAPGIGRALRSRATRRAAQGLMCVLAAALIADGLWGPAEPGANLAGVLPWTWWRGLVVVALLVAGNVFCWACPFTLPRGAAHRIARGSGLARIPWPRRLRSKWLAVALVGLYLVAYEVLDVWAVPVWTAWIALAYFAAAFAVDLVFREASFCKYLCPIGQFHFSQAALSPLEVRVRDPQTCAGCATHDCVRGGPGGPGCGLDLALPTKRGNFDCTFCLDCVRACPHDNVGLLPARRADAVADAPRSGVGRWSRRGDWAALALIFAFGAFANAAGMVAPVAGWERESAAALGLASTRPVTALWLVAALTLVPFGLSQGARCALGAVPRPVARRGAPTRRGARATGLRDVVFPFRLPPAQRGRKRDLGLRTRARRRRGGMGDPQRRRDRGTELGVCVGVVAARGARNLGCGTPRHAALGLAGV